MPCLLWDYEDVPRCARNRVLETYPAAVAGALLALLVCKLAASLARRRPQRKPLLNPIKARHFDLRSLDNTNEDGLPHGRVQEVPKSTGDRLRVSCEFVLVAMQFALVAAAYWLEPFRQEWGSGVFAALLFYWGYALALVAVRVVNMSRVRVRLPSLWAHLTALYMFHAVSSVVFFRSALIGLVRGRVAHYFVADFAICSVLVWLTGTAKVGDKPGSLYVTPGVKPSPERISSLWAFSTYSWIDPMIWSAYRKPLAKDDIWGLREDDYAMHILRLFERTRRSGRFTLSLFAHFKGLFALQGFWALLESVLVFLPTVLLKGILEYVADPLVTTRSVAWCLVMLMPVLKMLDLVTSSFSLFLGRRVCVRMRAIIIGEVYAKALRRKITVADTELKDKSAELGAIINLMAIDAFKVLEICGYLHFFVGALFMLAFCIVFLYKLLGWSALAGAVTIVLIFPFNYKFSQWIGVYQKKTLEVTDKRIQKMNETFSSIRIIKFFAWEDKFRDAIMEIRRDELYYLALRMFFWGLQALVWFGVPTLITVISFYCYTMVEGRPLTAPIAFTALSLFTLLRLPLDQLADMTAIVIQSKVSLDRVSDFLEESETTKYEQLRGSSLRTAIGFEHASFAWNAASARDFCLRDIDVRFEPGKLSVVVGATGAGKTLLLLALLGEMELTLGLVHLPGLGAAVGDLTELVAYCLQLAWLLNDSVRSNIVFALRFEQQRYDAVVEACGLLRDFAILPAGDQTEIGEKGIALLGGQKQRVLLARALYSRARHVLLDDCLLAVDSHTALWIYDECILGPLMANRTCVLVSHNVALAVQRAAFVVVMDNGRVRAQGTPEQLVAQGHLDDDVRLALTLRTQLEASLAKKDRPRRVEKDPQAPEHLGKLVEEESKSEGVVGLDVYRKYLREFGGVWTWLLVLVAFGLAQGVYVFQLWWLRVWAQASDLVRDVVAVAFAPLAPTAFAPLTAPRSTLFYLWVYGGIGTAYALVGTFRIYISFWAGIRASNLIFQQVLVRVLGARLRFFDKTPLGRIMNRFSKDIESVDQELTPFAEGVFACVVLCALILFLISAITPGFLVFAVLIAVMYYFVGSLYIALSRELKRFDSITKLPIHQHFSESLTGVATIRAYGVETRFMRQNLRAIDENNRPFFYLWVANRWLLMRTDAVGLLVMFFAGVFVIYSVGRIDAGLAGLSLSYAISFSENALWIVRLYLGVEMNMNSVERLQEYMEVEQEPPATVAHEPRASWPEHGEIDVRDVSLRYAPDLPRVIKDVTFHVKPCSKVGIVGRTGAGKSTIITAFFRFLDPELGRIAIDGVDICSVGLRTLRQAITIIPQDPTLFSGTIRLNLDPFGQYADEQIYEALTRVNLIAPGERFAQAADENQNKFLDLASHVAEGGNNLSQGQRQLMCLARSLLKSPKVILLDEATASIDYKLDAMIQTTIREEFGGLTILTIAHRLRLIIDYDRILVMDAGRVVEYDDPYVLIADRKLLFHSMCENSGELDVLTKLAKEAFVKKKNAA